MSYFCYMDIDTLTHEGNLVNLMIIEITHIIRDARNDATVGCSAIWLLKGWGWSQVEEEILANLEVKVLCSVQFSLVQSLSRVQLFATPWIAARQASLSITNSRSLPKLMSIESVMPSNHLILCHPLLLLPPIPPSIRVFSNQSLFQWVNSLHEVAKVLEFQLQHQSFQWTSRTDLH